MRINEMLAQCEYLPIETVEPGYLIPNVKMQNDVQMCVVIELIEPDTHDVWVLEMYSDDGSVEHISGRSGFLVPVLERG